MPVFGSWPLFFVFSTLSNSTPRLDNPQKDSTLAIGEKRASRTFNRETASTFVSNTNSGNIYLLYSILKANQHASFAMSFSSRGWYLKTDFLMSSILALLGLIVLGIMSKKSYFQ